MNYRLRDIIGLKQFQNLQNRFNEIHSFPLAIVNQVGTILSATAGQGRCTHENGKR